MSTNSMSMKKIQMVDLQGQYAKIKETVDISIEEVLSTWPAAICSVMSSKY